MKKQRWLVLLLVLVFVLTSGVLAACKPEEPKPVEPTKYTVTYTADGKEIGKYEVEDGKTLSTIPSVPAKEGYTGAWDKDLTGTAIKSNQTVTAVYTKVVEAKKYTISFNVNGGSELAAIQVEEGKVATMPADPTKAGFDFDGWYLDAAYLTAFDPATKITADMKLHAKWSAAKFKVTLPSAYDLAYANVSFNKFTIGGTDFNLATIGATPAFTKAGHKDDAEFAYESVVYVSFVSSGRTLFVYQDGTLLAGHTLVAGDYDTNAKKYFGMGLVADQVVYAFTVKADTVITVKTAFAATFDLAADEKWSATDAADKVLPIFDGKVELPTDPVKTGYTFAGWFVGDKALDNGKLIANTTITAKWTINKYKVTVENKVDKVTYELGAAEVDYNTAVGLKVTDGRVTLGGTAAVPTYTQTTSGAPLLIKVNGEQFTDQMKIETVTTTDITVYQKLFNIVITEDTVITITSEHRVGSVKLSNAPADGDIATKHFLAYAETVTDLLAQDATVAAGISQGLVPATATQVKTNVAAGEKVVWYVWADQDWTPAITSGDTYKDFAIEKVEKKNNIYKVTYTMPAVASATTEKQLDVYSCLTWTEKEYKVEGLNVETDDYILAQVETSAYVPANGYKLATSNLITSFKASTAATSDNYYKPESGSLQSSKVVFIVKNKTKVYNVYLGNVKVFSTETAATRYYKVGDTVYDAYTPSAAFALAGAHADQKWSVKDVSKVTISTDKGTAITQYVETGKVWEMNGVANKYEVYVNGVKINGVKGATTTDYKYEVLGDLKVELLTRYTITYTGRTGTDAVTFADTTTSALYGDTVSFKVSGTKEGNILYVKAVGKAVGDGDTSKMLGEVDGVYSFVAGKDIETDNQKYDVSANFTDLYFTVVYSDGKEAFAPLAELSTVMTAPTLAGYHFNGWLWMDSAADGKTYAQKKVDVSYNVEAATLPTEVVTEEQLTHAGVKGDVTNGTTQPGLFGAQDKLVASWTAVKPLVHLTIDNNTLYEVRTIKVNDSSIYNDAGTWKDYLTEMGKVSPDGYVKFNYTDKIVLQFRSYMDKDITGEDLKKAPVVYVGTKAYTPDNNGFYTIDLAELDFATADQKVVIRTQFSNAHVTLDSTDAGKIILDAGTGALTGLKYWNTVPETDVSADVPSTAKLFNVTIPAATFTGESLDVYLPFAVDSYQVITATAAESTAVKTVDANDKSNGHFKYSLAKGSVDSITYILVIQGETFTVYALNVDFPA